MTVDMWSNQNFCCHDPLLCKQQDRKVKFQANCLRKLKHCSTRSNHEVRLTASGADGTNLQVHTACHTLCPNRHRAHVVKCRGVCTVGGIILARLDGISRCGIPIIGGTLQR